jgi:hypothetical protein
MLVRSLQFTAKSIYLVTFLVSVVEFSSWAPIKVEKNQWSWLDPEARFKKCPNFESIQNISFKKISSKQFCWTTIVQNILPKKCFIKKISSKSHVPKFQSKNIFQKVVLKIVYAFRLDHLCFFLFSRKLYNLQG